MKKLLVILGLTLPVLCYSQGMHKRGYSVNCGDTEYVIESLQNQFEEVMIATGVTHDSVNSITSIWFNQKTGTFTMLQTNNEITCVISTGQNFTVDTVKAIRGEQI